MSPSRRILHLISFRKNPIGVFLALVFALVGILVNLLQSRWFAEEAKQVLFRFAPRNLGMKVDFTEFELRFFPPGIGVRNPSVLFEDKNIASAPAGAQIRAESIELRFRPFQALTGRIRIQQIVLNSGSVIVPVGGLTVGPARTDSDSGDSAAKAKPSKKQPLSERLWDALFQIHAESIALNDTRVALTRMGGGAGGRDEPQSVSFTADRVELSQWSGKGGLGYELSATVSDPQGDLDTFLGGSRTGANGAPRLGRFGQLDFLKSASVVAFINPAGVKLSGIDVRTVWGELRGSVGAEGPLTVGQSMQVEGELNYKSVLSSDVLPKALPLSGTVAGGIKLKGKIVHQAAGPQLVDGTAEFQVLGKSLAYSAWAADSLAARGKVDWSSGNATLNLDELVLEAAERPRMGLTQPASGGKITLGKTSVPLKWPLEGPVSLNLGLHRAHLHWLLGPGAKKAYKVQFRASGEIPIVIQGLGKKEFEARAEPKITLEEFKFDNQKYARDWPRRLIIGFPKVEIATSARVTNQEIGFSGVKIKTGISQLMAGGTIDFDKGFDIRADGNVDLADLGQIAEKDISGKGKMRAELSGAFDDIKVHFDAELEEAHYVNLDFGTFRGRVSWLDRTDVLAFSGIQGKKGETEYAGGGVIDMSSPDHKDEMDIDVLISRGQVSDLIAVCDKLIKSISWFPRSLKGQAAGRVRITGGTGGDEMKVVAQAEGSHWIYAGEMFDRVRFEGGIDRGKFFLRDFDGQKHRGRIRGGITYGPQDQIDWTLKSESLSLTDLDLFAKLDVPIRGSLEVRSQGKGELKSMNSETTLALKDFRVRGRLLGDSELTLASQLGRAVLKAHAFGDQATLDVDYGFALGAADTLKCRLQKLDFSPLLMLINPQLIDDPALTGTLSADARLQFGTGAFERATGVAEVTGFTMTKTGTQFELSQASRFQIEQGTARSGSIGLRNRQTEARLDLKSERGVIDGTITGLLDLSILEFLTSAISRGAGTLRPDIAISGSVKEPKWAGAVIVDKGSILINSFETPLENILGQIRLRQGEFTVAQLTADLAGGRLSTDGSGEVYFDRAPRLDLAIRLQNPRLKVFPFQSLRMDGLIKVKGSELPYLVEGNVNIDSALSKESITGSKASAGPRTVRYLPGTGAAGGVAEGETPLFKLDIAAKADRGIFVQNELFDAELKGQIRVVNTIKAPRLLGTAEVIQGKLLFRDRKFQIQSASLEFDNPAVIDPQFNLTALTDVGGNRIQIYASGRTSQPKIEISSNPALPESEILQLLAIGVTSSDSKRLGALDRTVYEQGSAAALILGSLGFNREVESRTGFQVQLDEAQNTQVGQSVLRSQGSTELNQGVAPKIVIRRKIGSKLELSAGSTVGIGTNNQKEVNAAYRFAPNASVVGVWDNYEINEGRQNQNSTSFGLDLKLEKRFK